MWKIVVLSLLILAFYFYQQNYLHKISYHHFFIGKLDKSLKGKKVVFLSDTHFRAKTSLAFMDRILIEIENIEPDLIVFAGDLVHHLDEQDTLERVKDFFLQLNKVAPSYLIYGDQDLASDRLKEMEASLTLAGAQLLNNEAAWISFEESDAGFWLMGLSALPSEIQKMKEPLANIELEENSKKDPKILLAHHPEFFEKYLLDEEKSPDLVLSGHSHGGFINLPVLGGLYAPEQGFFPSYDFGVFPSKNDPAKRMIVSRGIGYANFPLRVNNRPEIVVIEFE